LPTFPVDAGCLTRLFREEVELEGELARQGRVFRGWNPIWAIVTRSGFLHYFDSKEVPLSALLCLLI
jgi:hypothetical protein